MKFKKPKLVFDGALPQTGSPFLDELSTGPLAAGSHTADPQHETVGITSIENTSEISNAIYEAELASYLDTDVPTTSRMVMARPVKMVISRLVGFYVRFVSSQITILARELVNAMRLLTSAINTKAILTVVPTFVPPPLSAAVIRCVVDQLARADGRVLALDCATGELLNELEAGGIDAYGIAAGIVAPGAASPDRARTDTTSTNKTSTSQGGESYDLRRISVNDHLALVPPGTLGGALLFGFTDQAIVGRKLGLLANVITACKSGARIAIVCTTPDAWQNQLSEAVQDLVEGRPLHPATWEALLTEHGLVEITTSQADADTTVVTGSLR